MRRFVALSTAIATLSITASTAMAQGNSQPAPWVDYSTVLYASSPNVWVKFYGADAGYTSQLFWVCDLSSTCSQLLFQNHDNGAVNQEMLINHTFSVGDEVIFKLHVTDTGDNWFTGPASRNSDNFAHFATEPLNDVTANASYNVLGGFEDASGGGDGDRNDLMFEFGNVSTRPIVSATPEPASLSLVGIGLGGLAVGIRRRRKAQA